MIQSMLFLSLLDHFGRADAAYGGVFVALSLAWSWGIDRITRISLMGWGVGLSCWESS